MDYQFSFRAKNTKGETVELDVYQEMIDMGTRGGVAQVHPGMREIRFGNMPVNRASKGHYEVVQTGEILTSDDPKAP